MTNEDDVRGATIIVETQNNNNRYKRYVLDARAPPRARGTIQNTRTPPWRRVTAEALELVDKNAIVRND